MAEQKRKEAPSGLAESKDRKLEILWGMVYNYLRINQRSIVDLKQRLLMTAKQIIYKEERCTVVALLHT